jgi:hypothetical protein
LCIFRKKLFPVFAPPAFSTDGNLAMMLPEPIGDG